MFSFRWIVIVLVVLFCFVLSAHAQPSNSRSDACQPGEPAQVIICWRK